MSEKKIIGIVRFWDLGRTKAKGEFKVIARDIEDFNNQLEREFSKYLVSSNIGFTDGIVFAGFHAVGKFEFIAKELEVIE